MYDRFIKWLMFKKKLNVSPEWMFIICNQYVVRKCDKFDWLFTD